MRISVATVILCLQGFASVSAQAMQFRPIQVSATEVVVDGRGPIVPGDTDRLTGVLSGISPVGVTVLGMAIDSPGGNVFEAKQMVGVIRAHHLAVVIPPNSQCASACFLLLAASPRRIAATDALIGVHSASQNGSETDTSLAVTTLMARDAAELGVPTSIIGKMVETTPGRVEWLDPPDLALMHVQIFNGDLLAALRQPLPAMVRREIPETIPQAEALPQSSYTAGMLDRRAWDTWLAGLRGAYKEGAVFAQSQTGQTQSPSPADACYGPNHVNLGDFTLGCKVARQRLAPMSEKIRSSADYYAGWNVSIPPVADVDHVEQEYQGVYFCGRQVAHLTLKVFQQSGEPRRRALFVFGPNDSGTDLPRGAFMVEGVIDSLGGLMALMPVKWVSKPPGYSWFGLSGGSDDGGKTFSGRLSDNSSCTRFTLARTKVSTVER
jgi:hypothetical protein